jgi:hypothetical protein
MRRSLRIDQIVVLTNRYVSEAAELGPRRDIAALKDGAEMSNCCCSEIVPLAPEEIVKAQTIPLVPAKAGTQSSRKNEPSFCLRGHE